jgi:hypothetical protein
MAFLAEEPALSEAEWAKLPGDSSLGLTDYP